MAGKRHHYIPRFLQRGFLNESGKSDYTFVYLDGGAKRPSKIDNVGVEGLFYSAEGETILDDKITELEGRYAKKINELRKKPSNLFDFNEIAEIIHHFEVRTNNFRKNFHSSGESFLQKLIDNLTQPNVFDRMLRAELKKTLSCESAVDNLLDSNNIPSGLRKEFKVFFLNYAQKHMDSKIEEILPLIKSAMDVNIVERFKDVVKKAHINGLLSVVSESKKIDIYKKLKYEIIETDFKILLSDSIVIFELENLCEFKPFYDAGDTLKAIYFPISSNLLIYAFTDLYNPKLEVLNEMSAKCSRDFFIASEDNSYFDLMQNSIGKNCQLLTESEMQLIINDVIHEQMSKFGL